MSCTRISPDHPATISIYADATTTRSPNVREFESLDELDSWLREPIARRTDKRAVPLFARAGVEGPRKKRNLVGPMLVILDVDKSDASMEETLKALDMQGIAAVAHSTWSHGKAPGRHSYRVFVDQVCDDWGELEAVTQELFRLCALEPTRESWHSPCFFVPAAPDSRRRLYRSSRTELEESEWTPRPFVPGSAVEREGPSREVSAEDEELVRAALERVENGPRDDWITVGMALCSSGISDARELWDEWSRSQDYPDYSDDAQEQAWESFDPEASEGVGIGTILHMARERGWRRRPRERSPAREDFAAFLHEVRGLNDAQAVMERTHAWNAALLVRDHRHELRFVQSLNSWICFDGRRWRMDHGLSAKRFAKETATRIFQGVADLTGDARLLELRWAGRSNMAQGVRGTIEMAQPDLEVSSSRLDPNPMLLNVSNGTLDLQTHELRPHDPADMITKVGPTAYDPGATCEHWERFLVDVLPADEDRSFFQRLMGYSLQGGQEAKAFAIVHGPPNGGKSTAINACARAIGTATRSENATDDDDSASVTRFYAEATPIATFGTQKYGGGNRPELAKLMGARLVIVNEIRGEALESSVMKAWTGGDKVSATPKYGHPLGFYADGTIFMVGNELPAIDFEDDAMWARVAVVRFPIEIPEAQQDPELARRFDPRGVLAWMVRGHAEYSRIGLQPPKAARLERKRYRQSTDPLNEFWEDRIAVEGGDLDDPDGPRVNRDELYAEYEAWAAEAGIPARGRLSRETLVKRMNKRVDVVGGFRWKRTGAWRGWVGLRLVKRDHEEARPLPRDGARLASATRRERS